jgi:hypothetical protein
VERKHCPATEALSGDVNEFVSLNAPAASRRASAQIGSAHDTFFAAVAETTPTGMSPSAFWIERDHGQAAKSLSGDVD